MVGRLSQSPVQPNSEAPHAGAFAGVSLLSGVGALATKTCCFLPLVLAATGTGSGWLSRALIPYEPYFLGISVGGLALAWLLALRGAPTCGLRTACRQLGRRRGTLAILSVATILTALVIGWDGFLHPLIHPEGALQ